MLERNKKYIIKDVIEELNTGDIVRTNGDLDISTTKVIEGMILNDRNTGDFCILNNTYSGSSNHRATRHSNEYLYGWTVYKHNRAGWIELIRRKLEPKTLLLNKIKVLTKDTK